MWNALHSVLRPGTADDYRERHARIPDDLRALFDEVGIREWVIWRSGDDLFHLIDCDDLAEALDRIEGQPANDRWQADIGRFVAGFRDEDGAPGFRPIERIWSLSLQREGPRRRRGAEG